MIEANNLTKEFNTHKRYEGFSGAIRSLFSREHTLTRAVDNLNLSVSAGELVGYIGVNGAGKSTTIKMLTGILTPTSGECVVGGVIPYKNRRLNAKQIGVVFGQRTQLWWDLPVSESFNILKKIYEIPEKIFRDNLKRQKELFDLDDFYLTPVRNLSLGQKMRAELATAFIHEPKVLFLDEPTIGLDVFVKERIRKAIKEMNSRNNTTVILTTHDLVDIEEICERIVVIDKGKMIYDGSIRELKQKYGSFRQIHFDLKGNGQCDINKDMHVFDEYLYAAAKESSLDIKFHREHVKVADIINYVVNRFEVRDIVISEPAMEDVVKRIYLDNNC